MTNDWIIDVLTDLRKFSASNSLGTLADRLDDTIQVAADELHSAQTLSKAGMGDIEQTSGLAAGAYSSNNA
jgi:hypothetical protein